MYLYAIIAPLYVIIIIDDRKEKTESNFFARYAQTIPPLINETPKAQ